MIEISEGNTNNFLLHGLGISAFALVFLYVFWPVGLALFIAAIGVFAGTNGLELDLAGGRYRSYGKIWFTKFGTWQHFKDAAKVKLILSSENLNQEQIAQMTMPLGTYLPGGSLKVLTYDVHIVDSFNESTLVYEFLKYVNAKKALQEIARGLNIEVVNKVAEKLEENRRKRGR